MFYVVQEYLSYGYVSGQLCHRHNECVKCMDDTSFFSYQKKALEKPCTLGIKCGLRMMRVENLGRSF
jgi:hypothetical protein